DGEVSHSARAKRKTGGNRRGRESEWGSDEVESTGDLYSAFRIPHSEFFLNPKSKIQNLKSFLPVPDYRLTIAPSSRPLSLKPHPIPIEVISVVPAGPPVRFRWQAGEHVIENCWGPERIEPGWWRGPHVERDYYRVETATGQRFWLFRHNDT